MIESTGCLPRYDISQTWQWNCDNAPDVVDVDVPVVSGNWSFLGRPVESPLGMPAGPLLNGRWVLYYAQLGFDVLTYKTVRSSARSCYPLPNLQPVVTGQLTGSETEIPSTAAATASWAVSFGMPSIDPDDWRRDIELTRRLLPDNKILVVSVVGTIEPGWSIDDLAQDYARCASWAVDSGADAIETNFSCPNVSTCDGHLYQQPVDAKHVARTVRAAIGSIPLIVKIGHVTDAAAIDTLLDALGPSVSALAMTNSVAARIRDDQGALLFGGERRGICGDASRAASVEQTAVFSARIAARGLPTRLIGVGGISTVDHVRDYLNSGAESVQLATAAMIDPLVACRIRAEL